MEFDVLAGDQVRVQPVAARRPPDEARIDAVHHVETEPVLGDLVGRNLRAAEDRERLGYLGRRRIGRGAPPWRTLLHAVRADVDEPGPGSQTVVPTAAGEDARHRRGRDTEQYDGCDGREHERARAPGPPHASAQVLARTRAETVLTRG